MQISQYEKIRHSMGFTLIELLIVVAIIAILAAIAIPNFLEAQVRSKVSRTRSDMRTVAIPLEAYAVDTNRYPPDYSDWYYKNTPGANTFMGRLKYLTTPVAYMSNLPENFFAENLANSNLPGSTPYKEGGVLSGKVIHPIVFDYAKFDQEYDLVAVWERFSQNGRSVQWALNSPGPDIHNYKYLGTEGLVVYDPTNGTVSMGQIIRTSLGADDKPKVP